jgi:two-component system response regulator RegX3
MSLNKGIALTLAQEGIRFKQSYNLASAEEALRDGDGIDLIILDVNLPDGSGLDFCEKVRRTSQVPIVFLTANDMEHDIVTGFELGGDDYITKPFSLMVLRARVLAVLKRSEQQREQPEEKVIIDHMSLDFGTMEFRRGSQTVILSKTEQKLLKLLVINKGNILTREQLIDRIWSHDGEFVDENALTVTIRRLRGKLEDNPSLPVYIKTVYGLGYVWSDEGGAHEDG